MCSNSKKLKLALVACVEDEVGQPPLQFLQIASVLQFCLRANVLNMLAVVPFIVRETHIRMPDFYERWVSLYLETDFFNHFRMCRNTFHRLFREVAMLNPTHEQQQSGRQPVLLEKALLITVWYLAKGDSFSSISDRFNVTKSTVSATTADCLALIKKLCPKYICWPKEAECSDIAQEFKANSEYPDVIGAIDGCHIPLKVPADQQDSYLNRKFYHSINLQGICTARRIFTNIFVGFPGSAHDARVLRYSSLHKNVERFGADSFFFGKYHLVGDSAYPCQTWLMTPYKDNGKLLKRQKNHNKGLSRCRVVIENSFGHLKGRWRLLKYINVNSIEKAVDVITVCATLHNFCLIHHDDFALDETDRIEDNTTGNRYSEEADRTEGVKKRNGISNLFLQ